MKAARQDLEISKERFTLLRQVESWLEPWMVGLGLVWLLLLIVELTRGLSPFLQHLSSVIWIVFIVDFSIKLLIAPRKLRFLRRNLLTFISLALPALRILRLARALRLMRLARATRSLRLVKVVGSLNRGMRALSKTMQRRRFGYVLALTVIVTFAGAAGMYAFERNPGGKGLNDYGTALWWTAMIMTTMASEYWPGTPEGRILCLLLSLYAFTMFGYVTATLATFFVGRDIQDQNASTAERDSSVELLLHDLKGEVASLREELRQPGPPRKTPPSNGTP